MVVGHLDSDASLMAEVRGIAGQARVLARQPAGPGHKQVRRDAGKEAGSMSAERARIRDLERENRELRQGEEYKETVQWTVFPTNDVLKKGELAKTPLVQA